MQRRRFVFLNHSLHPIEQAHISVEDPGFLLGDGVFETCSAVAGVPFQLQEHLQRLREGLQFVGITEPEELEALPSIVSEVLRANELLSSTARVRITVSRGPQQEPSFLVTAELWEPPEEVRTGVKLDFTTRPVVASPWCQVKSTSRQTSVLAARAREMDVYDSLRCNTEGVLTEGTYSNLFCVGPNGLLTPRIEDGCLAGVTRASVLRVAQQLGLVVCEQAIRPDDLEQMQEIFLTSSMAGVVPVRSVQLPTTLPASWQTALGAGTELHWAAPGSITLKLRFAYQAWLEEVTCHQS